MRPESRVLMLTILALGAPAAAATTPHKAHKEPPRDRALVVRASRAPVKRPDVESPLARLQREFKKELELMLQSGDLEARDLQESRVQLATAEGRRGSILVVEQRNGELIGF